MKKISKTIRKTMSVSLILSILVMLAGLPSIALGQSVRADFNGDGFNDLAIGAADEDVGSISGAGAVSVIYGASGGLSANNDPNDLIFTQGALGIEDTAETGDFFGSA
ncbi:MAG: integrin alpha [Thermodesulfobacteriota bacterium]